MDQRNTIVKCTANPNCLFNHNGICDNYVITIGADGSCQEYVETELVESVIQDPVKIGLAFKEISKQMNTQRGQRTKCNFYEYTCDDKETAITAIQDELLRQQMCWYCDNGSHGNCNLTARPSLDRSGKCPRYISTGGNR